jgi:hypothetical protein
MDNKTKAPACTCPHSDHTHLQYVHLGDKHVQHAACTICHGQPAPAFCQCVAVAPHSSTNKYNLGVLAYTDICVGVDSRLFKAIDDAQEGLLTADEYRAAIESAHAWGRAEERRVVGTPATAPHMLWSYMPAIPQRSDL